jgi:phenylacetic acid degradation operon negative regulatory protein
VDVPPIRPLSARSVVLSLLLGAHPPELAVRDLVTLATHFDIAEATLRVALTRMVSAGDLERSDATYRLSDRMLGRQRRQDVALEAGTHDWDGTWETVVVTAAGRSASERADLRSALGALRLGELREGVWLRPANLSRALPPWPADLISTFTSEPLEDPTALAARLWALDTWSAAGRSLLDAVTSARHPAERLAVAAAVVRHLRTDPALPPVLLPRTWPAGELRVAYAAYQEELIATGMALRVRTPSG